MACSVRIVWRVWTVDGGGVCRVYSNQYCVAATSVESPRRRLVECERQSVSTNFITHDPRAGGLREPLSGPRTGAKRAIGPRADGRDRQSRVVTCTMPPRSSRPATSPARLRKSPAASASPSRQRKASTPVVEPTVDLAAWQRNASATPSALSQYAYLIDGSPPAALAIAVGLPASVFILTSSLAATFAALVLLLTLHAIGFHWTAPQPRVVGKVTDIVVYPVKSARGISVPRHVLDARGLTFDRLWMVVDEGGHFLSQRRAPRLATVEVLRLPSSHDEPLHLGAPGAKKLVVPVVRTSKACVKVRVWDDHCEAVDQGDAAAAWISKVLRVEGARLVRMADHENRYCARKYAPRGATAAFSDGFPLLLANEASLDELNARLEARGKDRIPMDRFRPNIIVRGEGSEGARTPFAEDDWSRVRVGSSARSVSFGVVKPCSRCKIPTIDQSTGIPDGRASSLATQGTKDDDDEGGGAAKQSEPTATLSTFRTGSLLGYRKRDWGAAVFFGQNLVGRASAGGVLSVGDQVLATPRRPRGWFASGVAGVHY